MLHPYRIIRKYTTFDESGMHLPTLSKSPSNIDLVTTYNMIIEAKESISNNKIERQNSI